MDTDGWQEDEARLAEAALAVLWGKSADRAGGTTNLLLSHLLDTAAVAERIWDELLAASTKRYWEGIAGGDGRRLFAWLCGVHDCGKATPAFQHLWAPGADAVRSAGLGWHGPTVANPRAKWRHELAGAYLLKTILPQADWEDRHVAWVWPLVAGHHGAVPSEDRTQPPRAGRKQMQGGEPWPRVQALLLERFSRELGYPSLSAVQPAHVPTRAAQLHLSGMVIMADWIASDQEHFEGLDQLAQVHMDSARSRAAVAWKELRLRGGWRHLQEAGSDAFAKRFGHDPRPSQVLVMDAARRMEQPGLLIVEAPMGEGKTKAALLAAEILAARFGADGVFIGMPTQATSDPMFEQVREWLGALGDSDGDLASQVALLHGKRMFNKAWRDLVEGRESGDPEADFAGVNEYGDCEDDDLFGPGVAAFSGRGLSGAARGPAEWFLGAKRGLLCPFVVGTIDQLLFAATRSRHVMLRMAGLAGKVVVLDEVHAADVYMSQFLVEGLRWLGQAQVPVVLLSATLPPQQRQKLVEAYLAGAASQEEATLDELPNSQRYPSVTAAWAASDGTGYGIHVDACEGWRSDLRVELALLPEVVPDRSRAAASEEAQRKADGSIAALLRAELADGGCALVIRNTVGRAQSLYTALSTEFGKDTVLLLHGRLAVAARADRTERCLKLLGAPGEQGTDALRPKQLIVVATQLAEQSFDVDADLLVTDLAPVDLLLQRIGRLHRHDGRVRPDGLSRPRVYLTGLTGLGLPGGEASTAPCGSPPEASPRFLTASEAIYGRHLLLRTAAVVRESLDADGADAGTWAVPGQVPELVASVYGTDEVVPPPWAEDAQAAQSLWETEQRRRAEEAERYLLTRRGDKEGATLAGLHEVSLPETGLDGELDAVVRDGEPSAEVVLVTHDGATYRTLSGRALSANGDVADDLLDDVLGGAVRLPGGPASKAAETLRPLPGWMGDPRLRYSRALVLDGERAGQLGDHQVRYDDALGLTVVLSATGRFGP
ncbi:CRISPR-associated helicase Cas3' [Streptomyces sp. NPDC015131]|uniref:CRISPR-associated helicase Cas3' n=1 Tax=Streptomyces sp. NPDC015131 TaxID=3364941 RepID=UPI0037026862